MRRVYLPILLGLVASLTSGCVARTLVNAATAPVRATSKMVDLATTSQSESDEKRGRSMRQREERLGRLERSYYLDAERCAKGDDAACTRRDAAAAEIDLILPTIPVEPR